TSRSSRSTWVVGRSMPSLARTSIAIAGSRSPRAIAVDRATLRFVVSASRTPRPSGTTTSASTLAWAPTSTSAVRTCSLNTSARASVTTDDAATTVSIDRRSTYRSRQDSVAGTRALEASKRDPHLRIVVSLDDKKLWVIAGEDTVMTAPVATGSGNTLVFGQ